MHTLRHLVVLDGLSKKSTSIEQNQPKSHNRTKLLGMSMNSMN